MEYDLTRDILPELPWEKKKNEQKTQQRVEIFYFSLTTCVYCKKGISFLQDNKFNFNLMYLDKLDLVQKKAIKTYIQSKYKLNTRMASPFVIFRLDGDDFISNGYDPDYWKSKLR
ncbi:hypothetical protein NEF87_002876 [Candidatus Lokiarchaeum ossiferum]|uniref:Glutaredoxin domain-containing protein n=1 Tax=Candidatus Lokiarchaeum ossiferum TaxID=2951803 RepID=A0ABY6HVH3_9ARCH|nr:hypothetical protein NEF87_002876 [Candidatus Lokiarchaeum sp. B-35]